MSAHEIYTYISVCLSKQHNITLYNDRQSNKNNIPQNFMSLTKFTKTNKHFYAQAFTDYYTISNLNVTKAYLC